jgi:serine protease Do/serine protease DegQ
MTTTRQAKFYNLLAALLLLILGLNTGLQAKPPPPVHSLAPMLERVLPAVVNISTQTLIRRRSHSLLDDPFFRRFFDLPDELPRHRRSQSLGSGVIVDAAKGYVLTNHHVIDAADEITVTLRDQRQVKARLIGQDTEVDLALLQIEARALTAMPIADSDQLRVGDFVVAIGSPFGLGQTVTYGIVSALGRTGLGIEGYENFIQTDASINPGNSGGALVDMQGRLVGINTAIVGPNGGNVGIGFAIPSNMAGVIMHQLVKYGKVRRGQLGIVMQNLNPKLANAFGLQRQGGALVAQVYPGTPADEAGLLAGDIILALNDKPIKSAEGLRNALGLLSVGTRVKIALMRNDRPLTLFAVLADPEANLAQAGELSEHLEGALLGSIETDHPLAGRVEGVQVLVIQRGSRAWSAGLQAGDIIVSVNRQSVSTLPDLARAINAAPDSLLLNIRRGNRAMFVLLQ